MIRALNAGVRHRWWLGIACLLAGGVALVLWDPLGAARAPTASRASEARGRPAPATSRTAPPAVADEQRAQREFALGRWLERHWRARPEYLYLATRRYEQALRHLPEDGSLLRRAQIAEALRSAEHRLDAQHRAALITARKARHYGHSKAERQLLTELLRAIPDHADPRYRTMKRLIPAE
ncbi:MAG: hypothetical protein HYY85_00095 [Deltaproteobacteria bacterium]|nr:hypothetical protein [Deltaproteobacteria bacterium]